MGSRKLVGIFAKSNQSDLAILCDLMKTGKVVPVIDKTYTFSELREAIRYVETGHARGKVVISFD